MIDIITEHLKITWTNPRVCVLTCQPGIQFDEALLEYTEMCVCVCVFVGLVPFDLESFEIYQQVELL